MQSRKSPLNLATLPRMILSATLMARRLPGEGYVEVQLECGTTSPFLFAGRTNKQFRFEWTNARQKQILRCPISLWNDGINRELLDQRTLTYPLNVWVIMPEVAAAIQFQETLTANTSEVVEDSPPAPLEAPEPVEIVEPRLNEVRIDAEPPPVPKRIRKRKPKKAKKK